MEIKRALEIIEEEMPFTSGVIEEAMDTIKERILLNKVTVDMPKEDFDKAVKSGVEQAMKECELTIGMTVKEAVERQTPKKVMLSKEYPLYKLCFNCHKNLFSFANGWQYNYCPYCGQALDWSDNLEC